MRRDHTVHYVSMFEAERALNSRLTGLSPLRPADVIEAARRISEAHPVSGGELWLGENTLSTSAIEAEMFKQGIEIHPRQASDGWRHYTVESWDPGASGRGFCLHVRE